MKVKIELLEPIYNANGTIYYAGFVNGVYYHFLSLDKLLTKEIKSKLLELWKNNNVLVEGEKYE